MLLYKTNYVQLRLLYESIKSILNTYRHIKIDSAIRLKLTAFKTKKKLLLINRQVSDLIFEFLIIYQILLKRKINSVEKTTIYFLTPEKRMSIYTNGKMNGIIKIPNHL
ncbi:hypothetical protein BpHYR1_016104 [Brachionus plicatilis]|uniref:Uncharacterized protein n=1 Tax=Brachionus plicatilis TaxID=10195 RepID=A0A3M7QR27_BRAPC|nr:hypothetical protein BpHYR1_016104 [Brachionus plicatilis]